MGTIQLALAGDVMLGRGVDQIMAHPSEPTLHETWVGDARRYVELAEARNGPIPRTVPPDYVWGDALATLRPAGVRIVNLETAVSTSNRPWPGKGIHYRMHPDHVDCLQEAQIDACALANNHVLDWCHPGLTETLDTLRPAGVAACGSGQTEREARAPAVLDRGEAGRVLVLSRGALSSGIPIEWEAGPDRAGVALIDPSDPATVVEIAAVADEHRRPGDITVVSLHWGGNWGYRIPTAHRRLAHALIDDAGIDVVHGHSSHHPLGIEIHHGRPIIYGCGDLITDYEGIGGHEDVRPDLGMIYLLTMDTASAGLRELQLEAWRIHRFRLTSPDPDELDWLHGRMQRECHRLGSSLSRSGPKRFRVEL